MPRQRAVDVSRAPNSSRPAREHWEHQSFSRSRPNSLTCSAQIHRNTVRTTANYARPAAPIWEGQQLKVRRRVSVRTGSYLICDDQVRERIVESVARRRAGARAHLALNQP